VVAARRRVLGETHPSTLNAVGNLAVTLGKRGDLAGAERLHAQVAAELARTLGPDHPSTLSSEVSLATVRAQRGDPMAPRLLALLVERCTLAVGADHPLVATAKANLAALQ
jgi:Tetratricopeptide repeat